MVSRNVLRRSVSSSAVRGPPRLALDTGGSFGRLMICGFDPLPPPRCQFAVCNVNSTADRKSVSAVHHHDFGWWARNKAESGVGGRLLMMSSKSPHDRVTPMSRTRYPSLMRS